MLKTVGRAIKEVEPGAEIVTAGLPPSKLRDAVPLDRYLKQIYAAGAARYFDTLAINAYAKDAEELETLLAQVRKLMDSRGDRRAKIWITEIGWGDKGPRHRFVVGRSRPGQADQGHLQDGPQAAARAEAARARLLLVARRSPVRAAVRGRVGPAHRPSRP